MNVTKWFGAALLSVSLLVTAACANDSTQENNQSNQESTTSETKEKHGC